jgi:hypothetical protein
LVLPLPLALVAVTGIEQTNDAERLRESLDWGGRYSYLAAHPATLVTILLVLAPTSLAGSSISRDSTEYSAERTHARTHARTRGNCLRRYGSVSSHLIPSFPDPETFLETEGSIQLVLVLVPQEIAQFSNYSALTHGDRRCSAWGLGVRRYICADSGLSHPTSLVNNSIQTPIQQIHGSTKIGSPLTKASGNTSGLPVTSSSATSDSQTLNHSIDLLQVVRNESRRVTCLAQAGTSVRPQACLFEILGTHEAGLLSPSPE